MLPVLVGLMVWALAGAMNKMKLLNFLTRKQSCLLYSISFISLSVNASSEDCVLIYDGLNPVKSSAPLITSLTTNIQDEKPEVRLGQIEKLNSIGIEEYVKSALTGKEKDYITISGNNYNLLDVAIIKDANEQTIAQLYQIGYYVSPQVIPIIYKTTNFLKVIEIINTMTIDGLENILIEYRGGAYSVTNFFLLEKDFKALNYLAKNYNFDANSNSQIGDMIDVDQFKIEYRLKASKYIDLQQYEKLYNQQLNQKQKYLSNKNTFDHEYNVYSLKHNCKSLSRVWEAKVKYAIKLSVINSLVENSDLDIEKAQKKELLALTKNPVIEEYLANLVDLREVNKSTLKAKFINSFDSLTRKEINLFLSDRSHFYYDNTGLTLKEYLFLKHQYKWESDTIEMSLNRLAYFLINNEYDLSNKKNISLIIQLNLENEKGKNLSYYLLKHAVTNENIKAIYKYLPEPSALYGLNPLEMLHIKLELYNGLNSSIQMFSNIFKDKYEVRL